MIVLSQKQILMLHSQLINATCGIDGVRDYGLLESALTAPFHSFADIDMFPSIQQKAARLCYGLVKNHAFIDSNKRIDAHAMLIFLALNKIDLDYTQEELTSIILNIASSKCNFDDLLAWIIEHQIG